MSFSTIRQYFPSLSVGGGGGTTFGDVENNSKYDDNSDDDDDEANLTSTSSFDRSNTPYLLNKLLPLFKILYGDLPVSEILRVFTLSSTLFFMIGGYWLLRSLKDPVLTTICGVAAIPRAKMLSVLVVLGVVFVYNKLLDVYPRHQLFYLFGTFYFVLFTAIAALLNTNSVGIYNKTPDESRLLGWVSYCAIESFGSVMVSLFWSFVNSSTSPQTQKSAYGFLVASAQIGSILGPTVVTFSSVLGIPLCYFLGAVCMLLLQVTMWLYIKNYGYEPYMDPNIAPEEAHKSNTKKKDAGVLEGVHLFIKHNYIKGIFAISCLFMVEVTIVDYTMKVLAKEYFDDLYPCTSDSGTCWDEDNDVSVGLSDDGADAFASFMGFFGQCTNGLSFLFSLLGTSFVIRSLGFRYTLLLFPTLCLLVILTVRYFPTLEVVFLAMMLLKGFSYALNNPTKEILYQPTSNAVKYKSKSWIDIFGARGSKALGSVVTYAFSESTAEVLVNNGSLVGIAVASFLVFNARFMGRLYEEYTDVGYIVGGDNSGLSVDGYVGVEGDGAGGDGGLEMGGRTGEGGEEEDDGDTACGLEEEGQGTEEDDDDDDEEDDDESGEE
jgi:AAA family ATP:ADP antiporter